MTLMKQRVPAHKMSRIVEAVQQLSIFVGGFRSILLILRSFMRFRFLFILLLLLLLLLR